MKKILQITLSLLATTALITSCQKDPEVDPNDIQEFKHIRVLVTDREGTAVTLLTPRTDKIETFQAQHPMAAVYSTASGRYAVLTHRLQNSIQAFDTGLENHGDHADVKGMPKWAAVSSNAPRPTHFKSKGAEAMIFNDGDGSLSIANENQFHTMGATFTHINAGNVAHHGAMAKFSNGTYAITEKDGSIAGTLPERVKIIDASGKVLHTSTVQTRGIHGNATDGSVALFGSASGILVIESSGKQRLIAHPADFGTAWFGTILWGEQAGAFVGYTAAKGAFLIDVKTDRITPIVASDDIMQCKLDYTGAHLVTLMHAGEVRVYDLKANKLETSDQLLPATAKDETLKPQLEATSKYLYVTQPKSGELLVARVGSLSTIRRIKVSAAPHRLTILGMESSIDH